MVAQKNSFSGLANSGSRREVRNKSFSFQGGIFCAPQLIRQSRNSAGVGHLGGLQPEHKRRIAASWNLMQFDRAEANTFRQVDDDELLSAFGQRQGQDQPV